MKKFVYFIGVFVIVAVAFAIPILTVLSFGFNWCFPLKGCLIALSVCDFVMLLLIIWWFIEDMSDV